MNEHREKLGKGIQREENENREDWEVRIDIEAVTLVDNIERKIEEADLLE